MRAGESERITDRQPMALIDVRLGFSPLYNARTSLRKVRIGLACLGVLRPGVSHVVNAPFLRLDLKHRRENVPLAVVVVFACSLRNMASSVSQLHCEASNAELGGRWTVIFRSTVASLRAPRFTFRKNGIQGSARVLGQRLAARRSLGRLVESRWGARAIEQPAAFCCGLSSAAADSAHQFFVSVLDFRISIFVMCCMGEFTHLFVAILKHARS